MENEENNEVNLYAKITIRDNTFDGINFTRPLNTELMGVIPMSVIKQLMKGLSNVPFGSIKETLADKVRSSNNMNDLMYLLEEEINFHTTIQEIENYIGADRE